MAKISLREYNSQIENHIDRGENTEAIAHCKFILQHFPKHIDTYRLLGKSYLENERHSEASDILQRIINVIPDDFISHIGMSVIREDEGDLNAAIWHMERAFEVQPSSSMIQEELRRLFDLRDGVAPQKTRLTRGALVRMYARGELYPQAIAEIRAALAEDPQRTDLEVILARMYFLLGQKSDAIDICKRLLGKLPYCYEANRIMAELLTQSSRAEEAKSHKQRVNDLDPYANFISENAPTSDIVPENAVMLEKLDWDPSLEFEKQPDWATTAGIEIGTDEEATPDWLNDAGVADEETPDIPSVSSEAQEDETPIPAVFDPGEQNAIPDWMKDAGWVAGGEETEEDTDTPPQEADETELAETELAEAEIPEWLSEISPPADVHAENDASDNIQEEAELPLIQGDQITGAVAAAPPQSDPDQTTDDVESWMEPAYTEEDTISLWLRDNSSMQPVQNGEFPSQDLDQKSEDNSMDDTQEIPAGDKHSMEPGSEPPADELPSQPEHEEIPDGETAEDVTPSTSEMDVEDGIAWLEALAARQGADEETLVTDPSKRVETPPDWLQQDDDSTAISEDTSMFDDSIDSETQPNDQTIEPPKVEFPLPDWMSDEILDTAGDSETSADLPQAIESEPDTEEDHSQDWMAPIEETPDQEGDPFSKPVEATAPLEATDLIIEEETLDWMTAASTKSDLEDAALPTEQNSGSDKEDDPPLSDSLEELEEYSYEEDTMPDWMQKLEPSQTVDDKLAPVEVSPEGMDADSEATEAPTLTPDRIGFEKEEDLTPETPFPIPDNSIKSQLSDDPVPDEAETMSIFEETDVETEEEPIKESSLPEWMFQEDQEQQADDSLSDAQAGDVGSSVSTEAPWVHEHTSETDAPPLSPEKVEMEVEAENLQEPLSDEVEQGILMDSPPAIIPEPHSSTLETEEALPDWIQKVESHPDAPIDELLPQPASLTPSEDPLPEWIQSVSSAEDMDDDDQEQIGAEATFATLPGQDSQPLPGEGQAEETVQIEAIQEFDDLSPAAEDLPDEKMPLEKAQEALKNGDIDGAEELYQELIQNGMFLEECVNDLQQALEQHPVDSAIWQSLGDAYAKSNRLQDALDAYTKAEELIN